MNRPQQKLMVKSYSHSHQPSRESVSDNVMKYLKLRNNVLKAQKVRNTQKSKALC